MDFVACHEEQIHIPGHIQSFGYLIGLDAASKTIKFYSKNLSELFRINEDIFGKKIDELPEVFPQIIDSEVLENLDKNTEEENKLSISRISVKWDFFHCTYYRYGDTIFLEFEKIIENLTSKTFIFTKYNNFESWKGAQKIWDDLIQLIGEITGYDRVMVYQFLDDGTGKVIAECVKDGLESFLNLHYPESDIPKQARALYLKKTKRIFSDVHSAPVPIIAKTEDSVDLTFSSIRSLSPIHAEYLKNAGVASSFSTSIVVENKLWGLVTCQNIKPKHLDLMARVRAEIFTKLAANAFLTYETERKLQYNFDFTEKAFALKNNLQQHSTIEDALFKKISQLKEMIDSDGIAVFTKEGFKSFGKTPNKEALVNIYNWAQENVTDTLYFEHGFFKKYGEALSLDESAAGVLIAKPSTSGEAMLIWFRKKYDEYIRWAGYDNKKIEQKDHFGEQKIMISPRTSFDTYIETLSGNSRLWSSIDLLAAERVLSVILETSYNIDLRFKELNEHLTDLNNELESYSYTISHDLGTPLSIIKMNAQMLGMKNSDPEKNKEKISKIIEEVDSMENLMRNVLQLSRAKNSELKLKSIPTKKLIEKTVLDAKLTYRTEKTEVKIGELPDVLADETMLHQVFLNIINNAVKYSSQKENPQVEIFGEEKDGKIIYTVTDNGIGISDDEKDKLFKTFQRLSNAKNFKGNGVGLSIVDRIMQRMGGNVAYESKLNEGTSFYLTFQKP